MAGPVFEVNAGTLGNLLEPRVTRRDGNTGGTVTPERCNAAQQTDEADRGLRS